ncbi:MAG: hypothetical protein NTY09_05940 [bacterium]|nr:hypothetical protein [bacterium]
MTPLIESGKILDIMGVSLRQYMHQVAYVEPVATDPDYRSMGTSVVASLDNPVVEHPN